MRCRVKERDGQRQGEYEDRRREREKEEKETEAEIKWELKFIFGVASYSHTLYVLKVPRGKAEANLNSK